MNATDVRAIGEAAFEIASVTVPPSKSYTNRAYIAAALASGRSTLLNVSQSQDSNLLRSALAQFGIVVARHDDEVIIDGSDGALVAPAQDLYVGNAGTALRFLTSFAALAKGTTRIAGDEQMHRRPVEDLVQALHQAGISCESSGGCPPVIVRGGDIRGGQININGSVSSQFISAMLLTAPYAKRPTTVIVKGGLRSRPYIDMTLDVMRSFGADARSVDANVFTVGNRDRYIGKEFAIEGDATAATYFAAAAAVTKRPVRIFGCLRDSFQGDVRFLALLSEMGCAIADIEGGIEVRGGQLFGIETDMNDIPDSVPTLAVLALFASTPTTIHNVAHLKFKESDRLLALSNELRKLGGTVELFEDGLTIHPGTLHGGTISTYNDHRIAMSFAVGGLAIPGVRIENPECVTKSFPKFWTEFSQLERKT